MRKILAICLKDFTLTFRDRSALILMLAAPFLLTLGMGLVTGSFSTQSGTGLQDVPVAVVNQDAGALGLFIFQTLDSQELADLLEVSTSTDPAAARQAVIDDAVAAAVIIPAGFSTGLIPDPATGLVGAAAPLEVFSNPGRPISSSAVRSIVAETVSRLETITIGGQVAMRQMVTSGRIPLDQLASEAEEIGRRMALSGQENTLLSLHVQQQQEQRRPSALAYLAPAMAMIFLMYTVSQGGRAILAERELGTLARLIVSPTSSAQVLTGKLLGIFTNGLAQMVILVAGSALIFRLDWGSPLAVGVLLVAVVSAATGYGVLLASLARNPWQVTSLGTALMLLFGILGGAFIPVSNFSPLLRTLSKITPNMWAQESFTLLANGGRLADLSSALLALLALTLVLFTLAFALARRRWASGFLI
jgi:ABC-2 type transport system permease protein